MIPMIPMVLGWVGKLLGGPFAKAAVDAYKAKLQAGNDRDRMAADLAAKAADIDLREAEINSRILIAEQGNWMTRWVRPVWSLPFILFTWKVVVWDKLLGWGTTDPLDPKMWSVFMLMVGAYYGGRSAEKVASTVAEVFRKK